MKHDFSVPETALWCVYSLERGINMSKCEMCKKKKKTYTTVLAFDPYGSRCLELCEECAVKMAEKTRELFEELTKENDENEKKNGKQ